MFVYLLCPSVCQSVCLSVSLVRLSSRVCLSVWFVHPCRLICRPSFGLVNLSICLACLSVLSGCLSFLFVCLSGLSVCLVCLCVWFIWFCWSVCLSFCLSFCLSGLFVWSVCACPSDWPVFQSFPSCLSSLSVIVIKSI